MKKERVWAALSGDTLGKLFPLEELGLRLIVMQAC